MIRASKIASYLGSSLVGSDIEITAARSLTSAEVGTIVFLSKADPSATAALNKLSTVLCITTPEIASDLKCAVVPCENPRLAFCKTLNKFFAEPDPARANETATVSDTAVLAKDVVLGPGVCIGDDVEIGSGTTIGANVVIEARTVVGSGCLIKPNTTIGARGFGFVRDDNNSPISFPHIGMVRIGDGVEIGANCTVVRAALDETTVGDHVKTDDHVHIAHNCKRRRSNLYRCWRCRVRQRDHRHGCLDRPERDHHRLHLGRRRCTYRVGERCDASGRFRCEGTRQSCEAFTRQ